MKKYETTNEFENFGFDQAVIGDIEVFKDTLRLCLDNVMIKPENSKNRDIRMMRTNGLILSFQNVVYERFAKEGLKYYDADGKLLRVEEDNVLDLFTFPNLRDFIEGATIITCEKDGNHYEISFDATDEYPYDLVFTAELNAQSWDRFMSAE